MKTAVRIVGVLIALGAVLVAAVFVYGWRLPEEHGFARRVVLRQAPAEVWAVISDYQGEKDWVPGLEKVESAPPEAGRPAFVVIDEHDVAMRMVVEEEDAPRRMVRHYYEEGDARFDGRWTYELKPAGEGTELTLRERGKFSNAFYRGVAHAVFGADKFVNDYLVALGKKLRQEVTVEKVE